MKCALPHGMLAVEVTSSAVPQYCLCYRLFKVFILIAAGSFPSHLDQLSKSLYKHLLPKSMLDIAEA